MTQKRRQQINIISAVIFIFGLFCAWGGMIYALESSEAFHPCGIFVAIAGYCLVTGAIYGYEISSENDTDNVGE